MIDVISGRGLRLRLSALAVIAAGALVVVGSSFAVGSRAALVPTASTPPTINGTPATGQVLTANPGTWGGTAPISFQYQWLVCGAVGENCHAVAGATAQTYQLKTDDAGNTLRVRVVASNAEGSDAATSAPTSRIAVGASGPTSVDPPAISGTASVGATLTGSSGNWSGAAPITYQYQWNVCGAAGEACHPIAGATAQTYTVLSEDTGDTLRLVVTATNSSGSNARASLATARVAASLAPVSGDPPAISGTTTVGSTLTGTAGTWSGPAPISYQYQWNICGPAGDACHPIAGATAQTYILRAEDAGNTLRLVVTATNASGSGARASLATTAVTAATPPPVTGGCPAVAAGQTSIQVSGISGPARLLINGVQANPRVIPGSMTSFTVRVHVTSTCGKSVAGALVYGTAVPYRQVTIPPEALTDASGWVTLTFNRLGGFPATKKQQLMVLFLRARKPGEPLLAGISTRRLVSLRVNVHA